MRPKSGDGTDGAELRLVCTIPPSVNHYMSYRAVIRGGKALSIPYKPKDTVQWQKYFMELVREEARRQGWTPDADPNRHYYVDSAFFFPETRMDANNYFKVMLDAITQTQLVWKDDNAACERVQGVWYDTENPRVELTIHPTDYIGIFRDMSQLREFTARCIGCTRYARNCSLLRRAKEGRIQGEILDGVCTKYKVKKEKKE